MLRLCEAMKPLLQYIFITTMIVTCLCEATHTNMNDIGYNTAGVSDIGYNTPGVSDIVYTTANVKDIEYTTTGVNDIGYTTYRVSDSKYIASSVKDMVYTTMNVKDIAYTTSGVNDIAYTTSGVNDIAYTTSGVNDIAYTTSGVNDIAYNTSGVNDIAYITSGVNDIAYTTSGVNDIAYTTSGVNDIGYTTFQAATYSVVGVRLASNTSCNSSLYMTECTTSNNYAMDVIDSFQIIGASIGTICNILAFITFIKNAKVFSKNVRILLGHQSMIDTLVCGVSIPIIVGCSQCEAVASDIIYLDIFMCYLWTSQFCYWFFMCLSVLNLLLIAIERYLLVCRPFIHQKCVGSYHKRAFVLCYMFSLIINCPDFFMVTYKDKQCLYEPLFNTIIFHYFSISYSIFTFIVFYTGPVLCFIILYRKVLNTLSSRAYDTEFGHTHIVSTANKRFTKTAITVTVIFVLSMGVDSTCYMLGQIGVTDYNKSILFTRIGLFLTIINPASGPFVYIMTIPNFFQTFRKTFTCQTTKLVKRRSKRYKITTFTKAKVKQSI